LKEEVNDLKSTIREEMDKLKDFLMKTNDEAIIFSKPSTITTNNNKQNVTYTDMVLNPTLNLSLNSSTMSTIDTSAISSALNNDVDIQFTPTFPALNSSSCAASTTVLNSSEESFNLLENLPNATTCPKSNADSPVFEQSHKKQSLPGKSDWVGEAYWKCAGCPAQFGFLLLQSIFSNEVLRSSNISGKRGLRKLDEQLVKMMKSHITNLFQVETDVEMKLVLD